MAKRTRSGEVSGLLKCDQYLTSCAFEEETWSPCVAWIVGRQPEDFKHIEALNVIIQTGVRKLFSVITKEQLCIDVRELGNSKNKKAKEVPPYSEICEVAKVFLEAGEPIPTPLMAKLIKWKMLLLKEADLKRLAADNKSAGEKKKGKEKDTSKERSRSPKKGDKKPTEGQHAKEGSKMKKRGEDDDDRKYIDDEPEDGAQYYFIITGFHDPYLFQFLEAINVDVNCIISVTAQVCFKDEAEAPVIDEKMELLGRELKVFWRDLVLLLQRQPDTSTLHDIARLDYEVSYLTVPTDPQDPEQRVFYSSAIFEDIALMLYNLTDARRMYYNYLANLKLVHVPLLGQTVSNDANQLLETHVSEKSSLRGVDMRYYNDLMNTIPNESVSVALIMHCMLEQVVATEKRIDPPTEHAVSAKTDGINVELSAYLGEMTAKLGLTTQEHEVLSRLFDIHPTDKEKSENPKLININDEICIRTHHLEPNYGFNPEEAERKMLQLLPISKYCHMSRPSSTEERSRSSRFQELFHHCATVGLSKSEADHALKQFVFECMELTKCDRNGFALQKVKEGLPQQPIPWDDPFPYFKLSPLEKKLTEEVPSPDGSVRDRDERDEEVANVHAGHSVSSVGRPKLSRFSEAQRISDVIMELVVTLDRETCNAAAEKIYLKVEAASHSESEGFDVRKRIIAKRTESHLGSLYSPRYSNTTSVRFDVPSTPKELEDLCQDAIGLKDIHESLTEITETKQRNLDTWCFAEHFKSDIFLQVLQEATYKFPFIEVYPEHREDAIMLVLHNPYNRERQNHSNWHNELHSNTGFRNYLENTVESIQTWLKIKEAQYKAAQLSKEAASLQKDEEEKQKAMEKTDKKGKRSPQRSAKNKSPGLSSSSSADRLSTTFINPYVRQGSIKAWQAEQMRLANEEDEKEKNKSERTSRSAQKIKEKQDKEKEKPDKQRKSASRQSQNKQDFENNTEQLNISQTDFNLDNCTVDETSSLPFVGYDTGNQLIHMLGTTSTLFPCDGGIIHTERTEVIQGSAIIRSVVKKDGHIFAVHIINPREDMNLPEEYAAELDAANSEIEPKALTSDRSEKEMPKDAGLNLESQLTNIGSFTSQQNFDFKKNAEMRGRTKGYAMSQFGSITAHLSDGMVLAISQFGPTGESYLQPYEPPVYVQPVDPEPQVIIPVTPTRSKLKGNTLPEVEKDKSSHEIIPEETEMSNVKVAAAPKQEFQELHVTCPDGLAVKYFLQSEAVEGSSSTQARQLMVRQSYPFKTSGLQSCESARNKYILTEVSRVITADGNVIKNMVDGSIEVLGSDGTLSVFTGIWSYGRSDSAHAAKHTSRVKKGQKGKAHNEAPGHSSKNSAHWTITYPNGERLQIIKDTGNIMELPPLPVCVACDPETKQIMCTRDDHVIVITYPDGGTIVEHADGTRISTYYKDITVLDEAEAPSPRNYIQTMKFIKVECPAFATVEFNTATSENLTVFGNGTNINVFPDGYYMFHHNKGGRVEIDTEGTVTYFPQRNRFLEHLNSADLQYLLRHNADVIVETIDPNGNVFNVRSNGESTVIPAMIDDLFISKSYLKAEAGRLEGSYDSHAPRFFIVYEDCSGTELLRYEDVAEFLLLADQNPAAAVLSEEISNHPGVTSITVLKPYLSGISEKWLKKYDQDSIVPHGLKCRDLKTIPAKEYKKPGPVFGTNVGKGLSIGTNIRAPAKIPILKCPEKLELRHLLQFQPVTDDLRQKLVSALHQFATEVLARMKADNLMSIDDPRSQEEKLSALDLKMLADSLKRAARKYESEHLKSIYEQAVAPPPPCPPSKPQPKRTMPDLEQDRRDKEDEEARRILRTRIFEPYFESELGKVFTDKMTRGLEDDTQNKDVDGVIAGQHSNSLHSSMNHNRWQHKSSLNFTGFADFKRRYTPSFTMQNGHENGGAAEKRIQSQLLSHHKDAAPVEKSDPGLTNYPKDKIQGHTKYDSHGSEGPVENEKRVASQPQPHTPPVLGLPHYLQKEFQNLVTRGLRGSEESVEKGTQRHQIQPYQPNPLFEKPVFKKCLLPRMNKYLKKPPNLGTRVENIAEDSGRSSVAQSIRTNVYGKSRSASEIILPVAIQGGKPGARPNLKFTEIEEPVRQKVKTSSVAGANVKSIKQLKKMRGLIVYPQKVDFGTLIEGNLYTYLVTLTNTGIDACRFKVRRPPLSSGLTVKHTVGSVAAGMSADMNLELYAIASDKDTTSAGGSYSHTLQIVTETDFLELEIVANILTAEEYKNPDFVPNIKRWTGARIMSSRPSQSDKNYGKKDIVVA